jgi:hypothetical protein
VWWVTTKEPPCLHSSDRGVGDIGQVKGKQDDVGKKLSFVLGRHSIYTYKHGNMV